jgi:nucleotidyltransferase AbiEii toxin of type IV toxin-antitoxin system
VTGRSRIDEIAAEARSCGLRPWIAVKERLAERTIEVLAAATAGPATLQGGAALHFVYASPRLSADVDLAGTGAQDALEGCGEALARAGQDLLGCPCRWSLGRAGRLLRGKLTIETDPAHRLVLPVEAIDVPARLPRVDERFGSVEAPEEIVADKVVASADRWSRRGTLKTSDLFDLWYLLVRRRVEPPGPELIAAKRADYGMAACKPGLGAAARATSPEELRGALAGILPAEELARLVEPEVLAAAATVLERYADVL